MPGKLAEGASQKLVEDDPDLTTEDIRTAARVARGAFTVVGPGQVRQAAGDRSAVTNAA